MFGVECVSSFTQALGSIHLSPIRNLVYRYYGPLHCGTFYLFSILSDCDHVWQFLFKTKRSTSIDL